MKEETIVYILRHGETEWNRMGRFQGHLNSPLTERGKEQARALAEAMKGRGIDRIYSSDLGRAFETADLINAELQLPLETDPRLRERNLGIMQGLTMEQFSLDFPEIWERFRTYDPDYPIPEGESARQRMDRTTGCIEELAERHPGETLLIVSHGGVLDGVLRKSQGIPLNKARTFSIYNGAVNRFKLNGKEWLLEIWGELAHLKGIGSIDDT